MFPKSSILESLFRAVLITGLLLTGTGLVAQEGEMNSANDKAFSVKDRTGSFYINWGYNRAFYRETDIRYQGEDFDFTLIAVDAHDIPEKFDPKIYFNPTKLTIPQFDFRFGYFLNQNTSISLGWDHMKYKLTRGQQVIIDGYIDDELSEVYGGDYDNILIQLAPALLQFEHSDGLNFVRAGIERQMPFWNSKNNQLRVESLFSLSLGAAIPWTDFHFLGERYPNWIHFSGWGASGIVGMKAHYRNHIYLQYRVQLGYINMSDILLQNGADSRASQEIRFTELSLALGYNFWVNNRKNNN